MQFRADAHESVGPTDHVDIQAQIHGVTPHPPPDPFDDLWDPKVFDVVGSNELEPDGCIVYEITWTLTS